MSSKGLFLLIVALFWFSQYTFIPFFTPYLTALGITSSVIGNIVGAYGFVQLVLRIPLGVSADLLHNHKLFIGLGLFCVALAGVALQFSNSPSYFCWRGGLPAWRLPPGFRSRCSSLAFSTARTPTRPWADHGVQQRRHARRLPAGGLLYEPLGMNALFMLSTLSALIGFVLVFFIKDTGAVSKNPVKVTELVLVLKEKTSGTIRFFRRSASSLLCHRHVLYLQRGKRTGRGRA